MTEPENVHATGLQLGGLGVMLRGPSGSGKSLLALALLDEFTARGETAWLVADDRIDLVVADGQLVMQTPVSIAGMIEMRGRGIVTRPHITSAAVHLIVDLVADLERMPEVSAFSTELMGLKLSRCPVPQAGRTDMRHQMLLIREALAELQSTKAQTRQKDT